MCQAEDGVVCLSEQGFGSERTGRQVGEQTVDVNLRVLLDQPAEVGKEGWEGDGIDGFGEVQLDGSVPVRNFVPFDCASDV